MSDRPLVRSFDLYDTLIARRGPERKTAEEEQKNVFPIAAMVEKMEPRDIIISDMRFAEDELRKICGLPHEIFVSDHGKLDGTMWPTVLNKYRIQCHYGDNPVADFQQPTKFGIRSVLVDHAQLTPVERELSANGFPELAKTMREARLRTWHPARQLRELQLLQIELNFPFLFLASVLLNGKVWNYKNVLFSSRDCCLWVRVQNLVKKLTGAPYNAVYFMSSRITRAFPSDRYLEYVNGLLPGVIVDVGGTGWSLSRLIERTDYPDTPIIFLHNYHANALHEKYNKIAPAKTPKIQELLPDMKGSNWIEKCNMARHSMPADLDRVFNPGNIDWAGMPEIKVQHEAMDVCLDAAQHYKLQTEVLYPKFVVESVAYTLSDYLMSQEHQFRFAEDFLAREDQDVMIYLAYLSKRE